jgi:hypothetical protein
MYTHNTHVRVYVNMSMHHCDVQLTNADVASIQLTNADVASIQLTNADVASIQLTNADVASGISEILTYTYIQCIRTYTPARAA